MEKNRLFGDCDSAEICSKFSVSTSCVSILFSSGSKAHHVRGNWPLASVFKVQVICASYMYMWSCCCTLFCEVDKMSPHMSLWKSPKHRDALTALTSCPSMWLHEGAIDRQLSSSSSPGYRTEQASVQTEITLIRSVTIEKRRIWGGLQRSWEI